MNRTDK